MTRRPMLAAIPVFAIQKVCRFCVSTPSPSQLWALPLRAAARVGCEDTMLAARSGMRVGSRYVCDLTVSSLKRTAISVPDSDAISTVPST